MVTYNPKEWFQLIIHFHKSDTFRILFPTMFVLGGVTYGVCYLETKYITNTMPSITMFHQILGFVISMVLVFRINTAYDRWWEGRKLWGYLVNTSRNLAIKLNTMIEINDINKRKEVHALISSFPFALKEHLRGNQQPKDITFTEQLNELEFNRVNHKPNYIASQLTSYVFQICKNNNHTQHDYLLVNENINQFADICGACERIKNTPIPYSYSIFIKKIIFLYVITMPIAFGLTLGYWAVPIVMIVFYAFASLELISEEIEDPFGTDSNDLPTDEISVKIKESTREILFHHHDS